MQLWQGWWRLGGRRGRGFVFFLGNNWFGMGAGEGGANLSLLVQSDGRDKSDGGESGGCVWWHPVWSLRQLPLMWLLGRSCLG